MDKSKSLPDHAVHISTYDGLRSVARAFAAGHLNFLLLLGAAGVGKSRCLKEAVSDCCWLDGNATPFGIYIESFLNRNKPLVLDDVDALYRDPKGIRLLKELCQSETAKTLSWHANAPTLDQKGIPHRFSTTSRVVIIANQWKTASADVAALQDRGHIVLFSPPPIEIHFHAAKWFWNQEVFDFIAVHLHLMASHSLRTYVLANELMSGGLDWKAMVLSRCLRGTTLEVAKRKTDATFASEEDRVRDFIQGGHGCRATYFNHAKKLLPPHDVPHIKLVRRAAGVFDLLKLRYGDLGRG